MKQQFYRWFGSLLLSGTLLFWAFGALVDHYEQQQSHYRLPIEQFFQAGGVQAKAVPAKQIQLPEELQQRLAAGETIGIERSDGQWLYYRQTESEPSHLWQLGPLPSPDQEESQPALILLAFYSCLVLLGLALLYPLFRDLQRLQQQAAQFMAEPAPMTQAIGRHSAIYPLAQDFVAAGNQLVHWLELHQFLSRTIAHEVRTPLSRMKFALELCQDQMPSQYQQRLSQDVQQIEQLVSNYLTFARLEQHQQRLPLERHAMLALSQKLQQQFQWHQSQEAKVKLQFDVADVQADCDPMALEIAWQNLLLNALRYAKYQVLTRVFIQDNQLWLTVEDDGEGFQADANPQAFERFGEQQANGFGLGLYIVKQVATWHQAELTIDRSALLGGARVVLKLPAAAAS